MKEFTTFSLKEGSKIRMTIGAGNETKVIEGEFMGLSDSIQPLIYIRSGNKNLLINMMDVLLIETESELEKLDNKKKADYLV